MMKKSILIFILLLLAVCLPGCAEDASGLETRLLVTIDRTEGCTVVNNGLWVEPGGDAVFLLELEYGTTLAGTSYQGDYDTRIVDGCLELTLEDIRYPVRVELTLTQSFATICYEPNGGTGEQLVKTYDLTCHSRPNTDIGTEAFSRDGYVLTGWNTEPDGSGIPVGLGSRVTVKGRLTLYAQWAPWAEASDFEYSLTKYGNITITGYTGNAQTLVIPAYIDGCEVTAIGAAAFAGSGIRDLILPQTIDRIAADAFRDCESLESVTLFDNIQVISDAVFSGCGNLRTLHINAAEPPYGYAFRKESCYADKVDILINSGGKRKLVVYGGCSAWYNLDGLYTYEAFGGEYAVISMGLNGTVNSAVQMQIMGAFLEEGDVLLHTLELTSETQLLTVTQMGDNDDKLWCGLEYNYDLFSLVDLRTVSGVFDSLCNYLSKKTTDTTYLETYTDGQKRIYWDEFGCIPFYRNTTKDSLADKVQLDPNYVNQNSMDRLESYYDSYEEQGVTVYVSYACVNMDAVPEEERGNLELMDRLVHEAIGAMDSAVLISGLTDFVYRNENFYDTNYHLRTDEARENTAIWIRDLQTQMILDGLWEEGAT